MGEVFFRGTVLELLVRRGLEGRGAAYAIETTRVDLIMAVGLKGIENSCAVVYIRSADLFFAFAAEGHAAEDDVEGGFGRHGWYDGQVFWVFDVISEYMIFRKFRVLIFLATTSLHIFHVELWS